MPAGVTAWPGEGKKAWEGEGEKEAAVPLRLRAWGNRAAGEAERAPEAGPVFLRVGRWEEGEMSASRGREEGREGSEDGEGPPGGAAPEVDAEATMGMTWTARRETAAGLRGASDCEYLRTESVRGLPT